MIEGEVGEGAMEDLLQRMREKRSYNDIKNLWVKDSSGHIHKNLKRPIIKPLESLPNPDKSFSSVFITPAAPVICPVLFGV